MSDTLQRLENTTFAVEHSPFRRPRYRVRLINPNTGKLDYLEKFITQDILGYGNTIEEAGQEALEKLANMIRPRKPRKQTAT